MEAEHPRDDGPTEIGVEAAADPIPNPAEAPHRQMKHRVTIQRDGSPVYRADVEADTKREAVEKVFARESTPGWAAQSRWQDVVVDELPEGP